MEKKLYFVLSYSQLRKAIELAEAQRLAIGGADSGDSNCIVFEGCLCEPPYSDQVRVETARSPYSARGARI